MRLSYLTVSVNYADYLGVATHHNRPHFDDMWVVTTPQDAATQGVCIRERLTPVMTDAFYRNGATFNKGLALNEGLNALASTNPEWIAIMDADTFVGPDFRTRIEELAATSKLDKDWMYGARRVLLPTWADYEGLWTRELDSYACPDGFCFGWLQLINWNSEAIKGCKPGEWYPGGRDCTEIDWKFRQLWGGFEVPYTIPNGRIAELPFKVFNLGPDGQNHFGRVSPRFAP